MLQPNVNNVYPYLIESPWTPVADAQKQIEWLYVNATGLWYNQVVDSTLVDFLVAWYFADAHDAFMFQLAFGGRNVPQND